MQPMFDQEFIAASAAHKPTARSRSTSAGSTSQDEVDDGYVQSALRAHGAARHVPEYEYPTPFIVKNTFIDTPVFRPLSLDEFLHERRVHSCPVEVQPELLSDIEVQQLNPSEIQRAIATSAASTAAVLASAAAEAAAAAADTAAKVQSWWMPQEWPALAIPGAMDMMAQPPQLLLLADAILQPQLGSLEVPTVGSLGHRTGTCKPCAFFYKQGCGNGVQCPFCHLCDSSEKKRRQKEKVAKIKALRRVY